MGWSNLFTVAGILFIGLTIVDFAYQAAAGLRKFWGRPVPEAMYGIYSYFWGILHNNRIITSQRKSQSS